MKNLSRLSKIIVVVVGALAGLLLILIIALQLVFSPKTLTPMLENFAQKFVKADVNIGRANLNLLKSFPCVTLSLDNIALSYEDSLRCETDTLAAFRHLFADVDCLALLKGDIDVHMLALDSLYAYAFRRDSSFANWNLLPLGGQKDSSRNSALPHIRLDSLRISSPDLNLVDSLTNTFAAVRFGQFSAAGEVQQEEDSLKLDLRAMLEKFDLGALEATLGPKLLAFADDLSTDAEITLGVRADGCYHAASGTIPHCEVNLEIPQSHIAFADVLKESLFDAAVNAEITPSWVLDAEVPDFCLNFDGFDFNAKGSAADLLGNDPAFELDAKLAAVLQKLVGLLPESMADLSATGDIALNLNGKGHLSDLSLKNIANADLDARLEGRGVKVSMPSSAINVHLDGTSVTLNTYEAQNAFRALNANVGSDSLSLEIGNSLLARASRFNLNVESNSEFFDTTLMIPNLNGRIKADRFILKGSDSLLVGILNTENDIVVNTDKAIAGALPEISLKSINDGVLLSTSSVRSRLKNAEVSLQTHMRPARPVRDTLRRSRVFEQFSKDSLMVRMKRDSLLLASSGREYLDRGIGPIFGNSKARLELPDFLAESDFRAKDIKFNLGESVRSLLHRWNPSGRVKVEQASLVTPALPLRNWVEKLNLSFNTDRLKIDTLAVTAGTSSLSVSGDVSGISNMLDQRGPLIANLSLGSTTLEVNQLLDALRSSSSARISVSDEEDVAEAGTIEINEEAAETSDTLGYSLIVVPANVIANLNLDLENISFSNITADYLKSNIVMRERCLQLANTEISTDLGYLELDAFYSTRTKKDISAGFDLMIKDATAEDLVELIPSLGESLTALKSFTGKLNTEMAGTAQLDTNMNFILPSIDGVFQIKGTDLGIADTKELKKIARMLLFRNVESSFIDKLSINGVVTENKLQIFPFILDIDRYRLALNGYQDFNKEFKYNISILRSPLPLKFGINISGTSYDKLKFRLGRANFRDGNVPSFTEQLSALQLNLVSSIKNIFSRGADTVLRTNSLSSRELEMERKRFVDDDISELSFEEQIQMSELTIEYDIEEEQKELDSQIYDVIDSAFKDTFANLSI